MPLLQIIIIEIQWLYPGFILGLILVWNYSTIFESYTTIFRHIARYIFFFFFWGGGVELHHG